MDTSRSQDAPVILGNDHVTCIHQELPGILDVFIQMGRILRESLSTNPQVHPIAKKKQHDKVRRM